MDIEARDTGQPHGDLKTAYDEKDTTLVRPESGSISTWIDVDEKRVRRKIDRRVIPLMFACYFLQYLDKTLGKTCVMSGEATYQCTDFSSQLCKRDGTAERYRNGWEPIQSAGIGILRLILGL